MEDLRENQSDHGPNREKMPLGSTCFSKNLTLQDTLEVPDPLLTDLIPVHYTCGFVDLVHLYRSTSSVQYKEEPLTKTCTRPPKESIIVDDGSSFTREPTPSGAGIKAPITKEEKEAKDKDIKPSTVEDEEYYEEELYHWTSEDDEFWTEHVAVVELLKAAQTAFHDADTIAAEEAEDTSIERRPPPTSLVITYGRNPSVGLGALTMDEHSETMPPLEEPLLPNGIVNEENLGFFEEIAYTCKSFFWGCCCF